MKTITVKQPHALLICQGIKDVENRTWHTHYRGRILIHAASKRIDIKTDVKGQASIKEIKELRAIGQAEDDDLFGCIIGSVELCNIMSLKITGRESKSEWAIPRMHHWILRNPILFDKPIMNIKGKLSLWDYDLDNNYS